MVRLLVHETRWCTMIFAWIRFPRSLLSDSLPFSDFLFLLLLHEDRC